ncbi:MAG: hypothetical protein KA801_16615, partial [Syntrophorhabdaceae bacterium]|nr:hypothetical protein [Syntrophorhabdaceae bacterium]
MKGSDRLFLFPLTSNTRKTGTVAGRMNAGGTCGVEVINTSRLVNETAEELRGKYIGFVSALSRRRLQNGKTLKDHFSIDETTSAWWFSLVAEKNTFKSDSFQRLAQMEAICRVVEREKIEEIYFGCKSRKLKRTLNLYAGSQSVGFHTLPTKRMGNITGNIREFQRLTYLKHVIHVFLVAVSLTLRTWKVKQQLGALTRRPSGRENEDMAIITYYPNMDASSADNGVFVNKYYTGLQEELHKNSVNVLWLCMYVENNSMSLDRSLDYAKRFIENGERLFYLEEFITYPSILRSLLSMLLMGLKFKMIERQIARLHFFDRYNFYDILK